MPKKKDESLRKKVLEILQNVKGRPIWNREISRQSGVHPMTVSKILDEFSLAGLIKDIHANVLPEGKLKIRLVELKG